MPSGSVPDASIVTPSSRVAPAADRVEVLEREADRIHQLVAAGARRVRAVLLHPLAHRQRLAVGCRRSSGGTFGGGGGGGVPSRFSSIHLPRTTGEVRLAYDVTVRMLPWPSSPPRGSSVTGDAAELAAVDVRDAVVPRQPLVDERVVGGQQIERRCDPRA